MKKGLKKISALFVAIAMMLTMCVNVFAAEGSATITVNNAGSGKFAYVQVIKPDTTTETGWAFTNKVYAGYFKTAFNMNSDQDVINELIALKAGNGKNDSASNFAEALAGVFNDRLFPTDQHDSPITVTSAGIYVIKGEEANYVYSPMAAYVSFGSYDTATGVPGTLEDTKVEAKKAPTTVTKTAADEDKVVEIGRNVIYSVTSTVPYIPSTDSNRAYWVTDVISGAEYLLESTGEHVGTLHVAVKIAGGASYNYYINADDIKTTADGKKTFSLDLSELITADNGNANKTITLVYAATVTDVQIGNDVSIGDGDNEGTFGSDSVKLYTGDITLTKYASDNDNDNLTDNAKLEGAKFVVYKKNADNTESYATFDENYKFVAWVTSEDAATRVETGEGGTLKVEGLDAGEYWFREVEAPEGYSVNKTDVSATLTLQAGETEAEAVLHADTHMIDTTLSALPSTGGIGTYIFTVLGVVIMAAAALLFFMKRRTDAE